jgi:hypothetical protein
VQNTGLINLLYTNIFRYANCDSISSTSIVKLLHQSIHHRWQLSRHSSDGHRYLRIRNNFGKHALWCQTKTFIAEERLRSDWDFWLCHLDGQQWSRLRGHIFQSSLGVDHHASDLSSERKQPHLHRRERYPMHRHSNYFQNVGYAPEGVPWRSK